MCALPFRPATANLRHNESVQTAVVFGGVHFVRTLPRSVRGAFEAANARFDREPVKTVRGQARQYLRAMPSDGRYSTHPQSREEFRRFSPRSAAGGSLY